MPERNAVWNTPNRLSLARLAIAPFLWVVGGLGLSRTFGTLYLLAGITDALDGFFARRWNQRTEFGARLDVWADAAAYPSAILLARLAPDFFAARAVAISVLFSGYLLLIAFVFWRTGEFMHSHLYSQKASAIALTLFVVHALLLQPSDLLFRIAAVVLVLSYLETALLVMISPRYDPDRATIFAGFASRR